MYYLYTIIIVCVLIIQQNIILYYILHSAPQFVTLALGVIHLNVF